jgi:hypothetical protein
MHVKLPAPGARISLFSEKSVQIVRFVLGVVHKRLEKCSGLIILWKRVRGMGGVCAGSIFESVPAARCLPRAIESATSPPG